MTATTPPTLAAYVGRTRHGTPVTGAIHDPERFVEEKFAAGWLELVITRDGNQVAGITRCAGTGDRSWWCKDEATA